MTPAAGALAVARRELTLEAAGRDAAVTVLPVAASVVLLGGLAFGPGPAALHATAPGAVWLAVLLAAVPLTDRVVAAERGEDAWDVLRGLCPPGVLLAGKTAAVWLALLSTWAVAVVLAAALFDTALSPATVPAGVLGTLALAPLVVAFGALTGASSRRPGLLAVLLLPAALPVLLAGTQASTPGTPGGPWLALLASFAFLASAAAWALFPALLED